MASPSGSVGRELVLFFALAFGWSWAFWLPQVLWGVPTYLGPFGPLVAALALTWRREGLGGIRRLLAKGVDLRFNKVWLFPVLLLMPLLLGGALFLALWSGAAPASAVVTDPVLIAGAFAYILFLGGPLEEEFGWRGYALDRLQARYTAFVASVVLGFLWGLWHLPLFLAPAPGYYTAGPVWELVLSTILVSVLFTWVWNNTGGSVLAALLLHTTFNLSHFVFQPLGTVQGRLFLLALLGAAAFAVVAVFGPRRLVRRKQRPRPDAVAI